MSLIKLNIVKSEWIVSETILRRTETSELLTYIGISMDERVVFQVPEHDDFLLISFDELNEKGAYFIAPASLDQIKLNQQEKLIHTQSTIIRLLKKALDYYSIDKEKSNKIIGRIEQIESVSLLQTNDLD